MARIFFIPLERNNFVKLFLGSFISWVEKQFSKLFERNRKKKKKRKQIAQNENIAEQNDGDSHFVI